MRAATWNVNGLRARLDFVLHWLREHQPDLVGLQELKLSDEQFPHAALEAAGYQAAVHGQKSWNGVAILSRKPALSTQKGLPGQEKFGARLITAQVDGLAFASVYVPNGKSIEHEVRFKTFPTDSKDWYPKSFGYKKVASWCAAGVEGVATVLNRGSYNKKICSEISKFVCYYDPTRLSTNRPAILRRFKRKCEKSGILTEIKKRQHYEKPSVKKKRKALAARKKLLKRLAQERKFHG